MPGIGPPNRLPRIAPKPPPAKAGDVPCQADMNNFIDACIKGDGAEIRWFLQYYPRQWGVHCKGKIGLMFAAENGREHAVELLLAGKSDVNAVDQAGMTALLYGMNSGKQKIVATLLEAGASIEAQDSGGWNCLHLAANHGITKIMETLLKHGPHMIDRRNNADLTPLWIAAVNGHDDTVRLLLDSGAQLGRDAREYDLLIRLVLEKRHADIARMLEQEPGRRRILREAEIDAAIETGVSNSFRVKGTLKLLKEKPPAPPEKTERKAPAGIPVWRLQTLRSPG
jgi:hypothetical protein